MRVEGAISVKAVIQAGKREVKEVFIRKDKKTKDFNYIRKICRMNGIKINESDPEELERLASGKSHGGILAEVSSRKQDSLSDGDVFFLDGIEDPYNLGYAMRTLYAFGVKNVLLNERDYSAMEGQLLKSSAGAYDHLNIRIAADPAATVMDLKDRGYYVYGLYRGEEPKDVFDVKFQPKALFLLGGEKRGIHSELLELCDEYLYISYGSDFRNSLNACAALDVVATLMYAQRRR